MRVPRSTYRLQFGPNLGFAEARRRVPYLRELGVGDVYASPLLAARSGSTHGYDVVDPTRLNPELGTRAEFDALCEELRRHDLGLLLDIVPNHMAASTENPWWSDLLERGAGSRYARFFDIDWEAPGLEGKVLLPLLGSDPEPLIAAGEIVLDQSGGEPVIRYHDTVLPVSAEGRARLAAGPVPLAELLTLQHYVLADWRRANTEINWRRFFDVTELVSLRAEDEEVFAASHALVLELVAAGQVTGLRIDHVDGLHDPKAYLERLQSHLGGDGYVVVEKILHEGEELPGDWPIAGTTGYEFLDAVGGLFVDGAKVADVERLYARFAGVDTPFEELVARSKTRMARELFGAELGSLRRALEQLARADAETGELAAADLEAALVAVTAALPVYRTYVRHLDVRAADRRAIDAALATARERLADAQLPALALLRRVLTLDVDAAGTSAPDWLRFVMRWQQLTGPVTAKGVEDTALYVYNRLISRNEVGSDPGSEALSEPWFHRFNRARQRDWPRALSATSTHDTKRSEDARARINVLSELVEDWSAALDRWSRLNASARRTVGGRVVPDRNEELLVYQTLVGAWPLREDPELLDRLQQYLLKAAREAKVHTTWAQQDADFEAALQGFAAALLDPAHAEFREDLRRFVDQRVAPLGAIGGLSQALIKLTAPGVPDLYQGTELWNLRLVDPDNRVAIDYERRERLLAALEQPGVGAPEALAAGWRDGAVKLRVTQQALRLRRERPDLFEGGDYIALPAEGEHADRVVAFARRLGDEWAITVVPRLAAPLARPGRLELERERLADTTVLLPPAAPERFRSVLTGDEAVARNGRLAVSELWARLPVALLVA